MSVLPIDSLSVEELRALDAAEQLNTLNDLCGEAKRLADEKRREIDHLADAKIALLSNPKDIPLRAAVIDGKRRIDKLTCALAARKHQASILQTLVNVQSRIA